MYSTIKRLINATGSKYDESTVWYQVPWINWIEFCAQNTHAMMQKKCEENVTKFLSIHI